MILFGALNYDAAHSSGLNRHTRALLEPFLARFDDLTVLTAERELERLYGARVRLQSPRWLREGTTRGNLGRLLWHQAVLPRLSRRGRASLYFSATPEGMLWPACPQIVTIHDLIPLVHPAGNPRIRHYFDRVVPRIVRRSVAIVASSEATAGDVRRFYGADVPIHVVPLGYRETTFFPQDPESVAAFRERMGLEAYVLHVGADRPHKNLRRTISAMRSADVPSRLQLAVVGCEPGPELLAHARAAGVEARVRWLGRLPDDDLALAYAGAEAFVFPSLYEGFGIPPLEAMACGCAVVAANASSVPEACGDAALYFDPLAEDQIATAIGRVAEDGRMRERLVERGLERARRFTYSTVAARTADIVERYVEA